MPGSVIRGGATAPLTHVAWDTPGATGATGLHDISSNVTSKVAVVGDVRVQPGGSCAGQPTPAGRSVAVTVTSSPAAYGPGGLTL